MSARALSPRPAEDADSQTPPLSPSLPSLDSDRESSSSRSSSPDSSSHKTQPTNSDTHTANPLLVPRKARAIVNDHNGIIKLRGQYQITQLGEQNYQADLIVPISSHHAHNGTYTGFGRSKDLARECAAQQFIIAADGIIIASGVSLVEAQGPTTPAPVPASATTSSRTKTSLAEDCVRSQNVAEVLNDLAPCTTGRSFNLVSCDAEWHEVTKKGEKRKILEIGLTIIHSSAIYDVARGEHSAITAHHLVIDDYYALRNGKRVPDNKDNFNFGESTRVNLDEAGGMIADILEQLDDPIVLVAHGLPGDLSILKSLGIGSEWFGARLLDTACAFASLLSLTQSPSCERMLNHFDIGHYNMHNAGNDSWYTALAAIELILAFDTLMMEDQVEVVVEKAKVPAGSYGGESWNVSSEEDDLIVLDFL